MSGAYGINSCTDQNQVKQNDVWTNANDGCSGGGYAIWLNLLYYGRFVDGEFQQAANQPTQNFDDISTQSCFQLDANSNIIIPVQFRYNARDIDGPDNMIEDQYGPMLKYDASLDFPFGYTAQCKDENGYHITGKCICCPVAPGYIAQGNTQNRYYADICQAGTYTPSYGYTACIDCTVGKYNEAPASTSCSNCPPGRYTENTGASSVKECCVENAQFSISTSKCGCNQGYYQSQVDLTYDDPEFCSPCPSNMTTIGIGSLSVLSCRCEYGSGYINSIIGCQTCETGKHAGNSIYSPCQACEKGKYQKNTGQEECDICPYGTYTHTTGWNADCRACPSGKFSSAEYCYNVSVQISRQGEDILNCGSNPSTCQIPECVDDVSDCQNCPEGKFSDGNGQMCNFCSAGSEPNDERNGCEPCLAGKYSDQIHTGGLCKTCPEYHKPNSDKTNCEACQKGKTYNVDKDEDDCVECDDGYFQVDDADNRLDDYTPSYGCFGCNYLKTNSYMDERDRSCKTCPQGKYTTTDEGIIGVAACEPCKSCDPQQYRTGCELNITSNEASAGTCVDCEACPDDEDGNPRKRVGCINQQGHNNASGTCVRTEFVTRTPLCPFHEYDESGEIERSTQFGLGGFTFTEVFGMDENHTDFQCRLPCDGDLFHNFDTGYCAGPFSCNVPSCTMQSDDEVAGLSNLEARACPEEEILDTDDEAVIRAKMEAVCQTCDDCEGRGCARECSLLKCEVGEIFDFSETRTRNKCKTCQELASHSLCQSGFYEGNLKTTDISGNRPKFEFTNCQPKLAPNTFTEEDGESVPHTVTYGDCTICGDEDINECVSGEYHASCDAEIGCLSCHPHGGMTIISSEYMTKDNVRRPLYCQVSTCKDPELTGVDEWGVFCEADCGTAECDAGETTLPCLLPHPKRCKSPYPTARAGQSKVAHVPPHANILERNNSYHLFANFENLLMPLGSTLPEHRHQCVWNTQGITDNDMNGGGIAHSFLPHGEVFASNQLADGTKFCHPWPNRDMSLEYPLLPLQNSVTDTESTFPRRVLVNTSARVMDYTYTGDGYTANEFDVLDVTVNPGLATEFTGDFFLDLDVSRARRATLAVFIPDDRNLDTVTWVPQWEFSVLVRESTAPNPRTDLTLKIDVPEVDGKMGIDLSLFQKKNNNGKSYYVHGVWDDSWSTLDLGTTTYYDGNYNHRPRLFSVDSSSTQTAYVRLDEVPTDFVATPLPDYMEMGTLDARNRTSDHVIEVDIQNIPQGVVTSMVSVFGSYRGCYATETDVTCILENETLATVTSTTNGDVIQSITVWDNMLVITRQRSSSNKLNVAHEFWTANLEKSSSYLLLPPKILCTAALDLTLWTLKMDSDAVLQLQSYTTSTFEAITRFDPDKNRNITTNQRYEMQVKDLVTISMVLSTSYDKIFVLVPVKSSSADLGNTDEVVLLVRMYSKDGDPSISTDVLVDPSWSFYKLLRGHVSYTSRAWRDETTVFVGFLGEVYEVNCREPRADVTVLTSSYLRNRHFMPVSNGFLTLDTQPVRNAISRTCTVGFNDVMVDNSGVIKAMYSKERCAHECFIDAACDVYAMRGGECYHYTTEIAGSVKGCKQKDGETSKDLYHTYQHGSAHTSSKVTFKALLRGFVNVSGGGSAVGYHALTTGLHDDYSAIIFQYVPYCIWYSGEKVVLMDADGVEVYWPDRMVGIHGTGTTQIQFFKEAFDANGSEITHDYVSFQLQESKVFIVFDLCASGTIKLWSDTNEFISKSTNTDSCMQEYVVIYYKGFTSSVVNYVVVITRTFVVCEAMGCSEHTQNFDQYSFLFEYRISGDAKIINAVQIDDVTEFDLRALTRPTRVRNENITDEWTRHSRYLPGHLVRNADQPLPMYLHVDGGSEAQRSVSLDALQLRPVLTVAGTENVDNTLLTHFYFPTDAELDEIGLTEVRTGDDTEKWKRLHITVGVDEGDNCRVSFVEVDEDGEEVAGDSGIHSDRLRELGCTTSGRQCQLEVPETFRDTNNKNLVGLKVNITGECHATNIEAWIAPLATLWECDGDSFWSEDEKKCQECETDGAIKEVCGDGEYVPGCEALKHLSQSGCQNCSNANLKNNLNQWAPGETCVLECINDASFGENGVCTPCNTALTEADCSMRELDAATDRGWKLQACSKTADQDCVLCPEIDKSIFSSNEVFVRDLSGDTVCNTTCKEGHYRDFSHPYYCRPCQDLDALKAEVDFVREVDAVYRFRECKGFHRAETQKCEVAQ